MKSPVRFGLIGVGGIGAYHLSNIEEFERAGRAKLIAVADPMVERFPEVKARLDARGVRWHSDYRDLLRDETELDAVTIATPIPFHLEMARACIERGLLVNLEKPPVPLIQQLESLIEADREKRVAVGFQMITAESVQRAKKLIAENKLGKIEHIRACGCWPRLDGYYNRASWSGKMTLRGEPVFDGPATNALAHVIHNIMFLASPQPDGFTEPTEIEGELYRARPTIESYDVACLRGKFASGISFSTAFTHATEESLPFKIEVHGSEGWARISEDAARFESSLGDALDCPESTMELLKKCYAEFIEFAQGERPRISTQLRDTRGYVLATNGALLSSGGIREISPEHFRTYQRDGDSGFAVNGLRAATEASFQTGKLFSELDLPWAKPPQTVATNDLKAIDFASLSKKSAT